MTTTLQSLRRHWLFIAPLLLCLGCGDDSSPVKVVPLPSPFITEVMSQSWLAIQQGDNVTVMRPDGTERTQIADVGLHSWSPDANWLAVGPTPVSLSLYHPESGATTPIYENGWFGAWSPDAAHIAFTPRAGGELEIWSHDIASGERRFMGQGTATDWSSDGKWISAQWYPRDSPAFSTRWVHLIRADGSGDVTDLGGGLPKSFSSDGQWFLYVAGGFSDNEYRVVRIDSLENVLLAKVRETGPACWSPVDQSVAFGADGYQIRIGAPGRGSRIAATGSYQQWSPDGQWLGFLGKPGALPTYLSIISSKGGGVIWGTETSGSFGWSPDSRLLAVAVPESANSVGIYLIDPLTDERRRVADGDGVLWSPPIRELTSP
jgi:hypothetical protein